MQLTSTVLRAGLLVLNPVTDTVHGLYILFFSVRLCDDTHVRCNDDKLDNDFASLSINISTFEALFLANFHRIMSGNCFAF